MRTRTGLVQWIPPTLHLFLSAFLPCGSRNTSLLSMLPRSKKQRNRNPTPNAQRHLASGFANACVIDILLLVDNRVTMGGEYGTCRSSRPVVLHGNFSLRPWYIQTSTMSHFPIHILSYPEFTTTSSLSPVPLLPISNGSSTGRRCL
jgi:hypothetical protein